MTLEDAKRTVQDALEHPWNYVTAEARNLLQEAKNFIQNAASTAAENAPETPTPPEGATEVANTPAKVRNWFDGLGKKGKSEAERIIRENMPIRRVIVPIPGQTMWIDTAKTCIDNRQSMQIIISGPDATTLINAFQAARGEAPVGLSDPNSTQNLVVADDVGAGTIITVSALLTAVAIVTLFVILVICLYAIYNNYKVGITWHRNGPLPFDDQLEINLDPR